MTLGLGLMAELLGGALLGKVEIEAGLGLNMLIILVDTKIFLTENILDSNVKSILDEIRNCPPAPGHKVV